MIREDFFLRKRNEIRREKANFLEKKRKTFSSLFCICPELALFPSHSFFSKDLSLLFDEMTLLYNMVLMAEGNVRTNVRLIIRKSDFFFEDFQLLSQPSKLVIYYIITLP